MIKLIEKIIKKNVMSTSDGLLEKFSGFVTTYKPDFYCYKKGTIPVLLMAHVDTCQHYPLFEETSFPIYKCLGADDRVGVSIIEYLLKKYDFHFLLTNNEETDSSGARMFINDDIDLGDVNIIIGLDRQGSSHYVTYHDTPQPALHRYMEKFGLYEGYGSYSDCKLISNYYNICHVNLSVGYYDQHYNTERINILEVISSIYTVEKMLVSPPKHKLIPKKTLNTKNRYNHTSYYDIYNSDDIDDIIECDFCGELVSISNTIKDFSGYVVCNNCNKYLKEGLF